MLSSLALALIITNAIFMVLAGLAVLLRIYARKLNSLPLSRDDYFIVAAWILCVALVITNIIGVPVGDFGSPFAELSPEKIELFLKILFVMQFWYIFAIALIKFSVLCFYGRIFSIARYPRVVKIFLILTLGWIISFFIVTLFQVWPIYCNWIMCPPSTTNYNLMYALCSATDIILDIGILCIPVWFIRKLQMSVGQKIGLAVVFGLGIFCVVSSVARLVYAVLTVEAGNSDSWIQSFDSEIVSMIMWSGIESCASVICASLPCYTALVGHKSLDVFFKKLSKTFSNTRRSTYYSNSGKKGSQATTSSAENIVEHVERGGFEIVIRGSGENDRRNDIEMGKINVQTTVETHEHSLDG